MSFAVTFIKHVHSCFAGVASGDVWLEREFVFDFAPFRGLSVVNGDFEVTVGDDAEIVWDNVARRFRVWVTPDKTLYNEDLKSGSPLLRRKDTSRLDAIVKEWVDAGWEVRKR